MRLKRIGGRIELNYSFKTSVFQISRSRARGDVSRARILPRVPRGLPRVRPGPAVTRPALGHQPGAADTRDRDGEAKYSETLNSEKTFRIICKRVSRCLSLQCSDGHSTTDVSPVLTNPLTITQLLGVMMLPSVGVCGGVRAGDAGGAAQRREKRARGPATGSSAQSPATAGTTGQSRS